MSCLHHRLMVFSSDRCFGGFFLIMLCSYIQQMFSLEHKLTQFMLLWKVIAVKKLKGKNHGNKQNGG